MGAAMSRSIIHLIFVAGIASALPPPAWSQEKPAEASAPAEIAPIAVADILTRADSDERFAEGVERRVAAPDPTVALSRRLDVISASVDEKLLAMTPEQLRQLPVMRLESLVRHWRFDARRFDHLELDVRQSAAVYNSDAAELARRRSAWRVTRDASGADSIPAVLIARMDMVIGELQVAEQSLSEPLTRQIDLQRRASAINDRIQSGHNAVVAAIDNIDARLLYLDSPPLWDLRNASRSSGEIAAQFPGLQIEARFVQAYATARTGNQITLRLVQLVLLPLLLWMIWRDRRKEPGKEAHPGSAQAMRRPISSWLLLSMMAVLALEPEAPLLVHHTAMLVALVPVLRLLPPGSYRLLGRWPYIAAALYLVAGVGYVFSTNPFHYRIFILVLTTVALALLLWLLLRTRGATTTTVNPAIERIRRWTQAAGWLSVGLFGLSVVFNVLGNISLAEMLTSGTVDSGYLALMLYAGLTVFFALLEWLLTRTRLASLAGQHARTILAVTTRLLTVATIIGWLAFAMHSFRILRPVYSFVKGVLSREFSFGDISISLGSVLIFAVSVVVAIWTARIVRMLLRDQVLSRLPLARGVGNSIATLSYYALLVLGLVLAVSATGVKSSQLALVVGALGVGIGFGLQNVVNNFVSGLILMFERPVQPGDVVDVGTTSGRVWNIGMRATTIRTFEGADVVVPNGALISNNLTNWTLLDRSRRMEIPVGVAYGSKPAVVLDLLRTTARGTPGVSQAPAAEALFIGFGANSLDFSVRAWTADFDSWVNIRSEIVTRIHTALGEAGIEIPFPQQDLHLRSVSKDAAATLSGLRDPPAA
jgi:small-conductance mechanosensitive channel